MSLIDEALRRAQAAQTADSASRGLRVPMPLPDPSRYRRRQALRVGVAALALVLAAAGAWLWRRRSEGIREPLATPRHAAPQTPAGRVAAGAAPTDAPSSTPTATASPSGRAFARAAATATPVAGAPEAKAAPAIAPTTPATRRPAEAAATTPTPTSTSRPPTSAPRDALRRAPPETPIILPPVEVSNASGSPRIAAPGRARSDAPRPEAPRAEAVPTPEPTVRAKTFTGTAMLPSGKLELGGIVYSEGSPTALINGRVVRPGSYVDGYTVVRIEPNRVELKNETGAIILNLK